MEKTEEIRLSLSQLQKGITVKLPLSWTDHPFLFNKIEIISDAQINMIRQLGVPYVILLSGTLENAAEPLVAESNVSQPAEILPALDKLARKHLRQSQSQFINALNGIRGGFGKVVSDPEGASREISVLVETMLTQLLDADTAHLALVISGESRPTATQHGVSVAVLSMMMGKALQLPKPALRTLATGALLHDIGKLRIPPAIRNKRGALTTPEKNFIAMHPTYGHELLKRGGMFSDEVLDIVWHHHEFMDGSGYPDGLDSGKLPLTTQIVALVNDYDNLLWRDEMVSPQVALGYLFKNRVKQHSDTLIQALVKILGVYPPGTLVQLTDDSLAKVVVTTNNVMQPLVWCCQRDGKKGCYRILSEEETSIARALKVEELSENAKKTLRLDAGISFYFCQSGTC
ncbi:HD-GYP domain-containing protein [Shewanella sp. YIC-542]|uniref:HD-GYP domain-containing protein n=1 Tax=Shewanella mytili TaxID=3377111 RepID=UPI00398F6B6C